MHLKTQQHLIILLFWACVALAAASLVYYLSARSIATVRTSALSLVEKQGASEKALSLQHVISDTADDREELDRAFILKEGVVGFIELLERLGKESGTELEITNVSVGSGDDATGLELLVLHVNATGSWAATSRFSALVEALPYALVIKSMYFKKQNDEIWRVAIVLDVYKHR